MPTIIDDPAYFEAIVKAEGRSTGLIPRNYSTHPAGCYAAAPTAPDDWLVPPNEYASRLKDQQDAQASLFDLRKSYYAFLKSLDQDGYGLCWAFSTTKAIMYLRALMGMPGLILSAWWVAGKVKGWRDQGGWGAESCQKIADAGVPSMTLCPAYKSTYDTSAVAADAGNRKVIKWYDGTEDRQRNKDMMISAFLLGPPPVLDYNDISHSMCGCRLVSLDPLVVDCDNSWGENSGTDQGLYRRTGNAAIPDGIVVPRLETAS